MTQPASTATGQSSPFDAWVKLVEYIGKEVHPGSTMEALMYDVDEAFQRQKDAPPFTRPADELAKKLDACKLIVVDYGSFSEFTGKAAVPTDLLGEVVACLKSIPSASTYTPSAATVHSMTGDCPTCGSSVHDEIHEDAERYRWFRDCPTERQLDILELAGEFPEMLDHHIDKGRVGL